MGYVGLRIPIGYLETVTRCTKMHNDTTGEESETSIAPTIRECHFIH
jgi:hypothetical protein